ncbi:hypothetical protein NDU88_004954 [Pleurodeles waltl]|uniref:Uncharacterized protein n=1 Tax=Pleurodeles waltl TaxID=8319 RepID=A0AAV7QJD5_PLEWA|nr:hypothetical protein NDU88_004954 [Pleurodeles waltl]
MYRPSYYKAPICQIFQGGTNAIKSTAETEQRRGTTHLWALHEEPGRRGDRIADPTHVGVSTNTPQSRKKAAAATMSHTPSCSDLGCQLRVVPLLEVVPQVACPRSRTSPAASDGCPLVMLLTSDRVVPAGHVAVQKVVQVALAAAEMLPVLSVVQVSVVVEGDTIPSLAASDG